MRMMVANWGKLNDTEKVHYAETVIGMNREQLIGLENVIKSVEPFPELKIKYAAVYAARAGALEEIKHYQDQIDYIKSKSPEAQ